jgi:hypothetical protein
MQLEQDVYDKSRELAAVRLRIDEQTDLHLLERRERELEQVRLNNDLKNENLGF